MAEKKVIGVPPEVFMADDRRVKVIRNALRFHPRGRKPEHDAAWKALDEIIAENERLRQQLGVPGLNPPEGYFDV